MTQETGEQTREAARWHFAASCCSGASTSCCSSANANCCSSTNASGAARKAEAEETGCC